MLQKPRCVVPFSGPTGRGRRLNAEKRKGTRGVRKQRLWRKRKAARHARKSAGLLIRNPFFSSRIRHIMQLETRLQYHNTAEAHHAVQEATNAFITGVSGAAKVLARHVNRAIVLPKDMKRLSQILEKFGSLSA